MAPIVMTDSRRILVSAVIILATFMQALDSSIANVALPYMQGSLNASQDQTSWVITSYVVATAIATTMSGYLGDRFGRKEVFVASIVGFTVASVLCGMAQTLPQMVIFRVLQGASAASVIPLAQALMVTIWPKEKLGIAMSSWSMGVMVSPILGPTLGGYITDALNWRWVFLINVLPGILCAFGLFVLVPSSLPDTGKKLNFMGFAYLAIAVGTLQLVLDRGPVVDWFGSREIIIETVISAVTFFLFLVDMFTSKDPFISPAIFRDLHYSTGVSLNFFTSLFMMASMVLWPNMLQVLMGYPVTTAGLLMVPRGIGGIIAMFVTGRILRRVGYRPLIVIGLAVMALSQWWASGLTLGASAEWLSMIVFWNGAGIGIAIVPMSTMIFETIEPRYLTQASVSYNLIRNMGTSIGISIMVAMVSHYTIVNHAIFSESIGMFSSGLRHFITSGSMSPEVAGAVENEIGRQAGMTAYCNTYLFMSYGLLAMIPVVLFNRSGKKATSLSTPIAHEM